ncbi:MULTISPECIES: serine hydrolase domain-containing protein [Streptomyces]|uniref:Serine hydrolase domain-containing protein n=1 Tax=Streptomyces flavovirens TaxID=52258 RepID=A0ABV8N8X0_9ACTN|nr:serine hydrolase domain-containing protein [Streptomyces sp. MBT51]MBK3590948.1 beta-lactamase family protein [Streptomyces sp. MBT51]
MRPVPTCTFSSGQAPQVLHGHDLDAYVQIGSLSKTLTGTALAQLAAKGVLQPDAPVEQFLPVPRGTGITLRHLAQHTSGLPRLPPRMKRRDPYAAFDDAALHSVLQGLDTLATTAPGHTEEYSNLGYAVLGAALTSAAGMSYQDLLDHYVLVPLGITEVNSSPPPDRRLYSRGLFGRPRRPWTMTGAILPAGGLWATPKATADLVTALLVERKLGEPALSWQKAGPLLWHNGATGDASAFAGAMPDGRWALIHRLTNQADSTDELGIKLLQQASPSNSAEQQAPNHPAEQQEDK